MKEYFFENRGLYYRANAFRPGRQTLVFIHGISGSSSAWLEYEEKFERRYNLLSLDLRGHGKSRKLPRYGDYAVEQFTRDVYELAAFLGIEKFVLVSHSFGTLIAQRFIAEHPQMVIAAVFLSPIASPGERTAARIAEPLLAAVKVLQILPFSPRSGGHIDYLKYRNTGDWNIRRMYADIKNTGLRVFLYCTKQSYAFNGEDFLPHIDVPVLIVHGKKDSIFPVKYGIRMAGAIKNSKLMLLENADHILVLNNFPEVSEAIEDFIERSIGE